jgi:hypothetical protein
MESMVELTMKRLLAMALTATMAAGCVPYYDPNNHAYYDDPALAHARAEPPLWQADPWYDPFWDRPRYGYGPGIGYGYGHGGHRKKDRLTIDSAVYQSENGPSVDASRYVRKECQGERDCDVKAKNKIFGDPDIGAHKDLIVQYRCGNGPQRRLRVPEKREMDIDCD